MVDFVAASQPFACNNNFGRKFTFGLIGLFCGDRYKLRKSRENILLHRWKNRLCGGNYPILIERMDKLVPRSSARRTGDYALNDREFGELIVKVGEWRTYPTIKKEHDTEDLPDRRRLGEYRSQGIAINNKRSLAEARLLLRAICRVYLHLAPSSEMFLYCSYLCDLAGFTFCAGDLFFCIHSHKGSGFFERNTKYTLRRIKLEDLIFLSECSQSFQEFAQLGVVEPKLLSQLLSKPFLRGLCIDWHKLRGTQLYPLAVSNSAYRVEILKSKDPQGTEIWRQRYQYSAESSIRVEFGMVIDLFNANLRVDLLELAKAGDIPAPQMSNPVVSEGYRAMIESDEAPEEFSVPVREIFEEMVLDSGGSWRFTDREIANREEVWGLYKRANPDHDPVLV